MNKKLIVASLFICIIFTLFNSDSIYAGQKTNFIKNLYVGRNIITGIAYNENVSVIVESNGCIRLSYDNINWTIQNSGTKNQLNCISWGNNQFIAVGIKGTILRSKDGIIWENIHTNFTENLNKVIWNGTMFFIVGDNGTILQSKDADIWQKVSSGTNANLNGIAWNGKTLIVTGNKTNNSGLKSNEKDSIFSISLNATNGFILSSPDGKSWVKSEMKDMRMNGIFWDGDSFLLPCAQFTDTEIHRTYPNGESAVEEMAKRPHGLIMKSIDGVNWVKSSIKDSIGFGIFSILKNDTKYIGITLSGVVESNDGFTWNINEDYADVLTALYDHTPDRTYFDIIKIKDKIAIVGNNGSITTMTKEGQKDIVFLEAPGHFTPIDDLIWDGKKFLGFVKGYEDGLFAESYDGINWAFKPADCIGPRLKLGSSYTPSINSIAYNGKKYIAVGSGFFITESEDGENWNEVDEVKSLEDLNISFRKIAWIGDRFLAIADKYESPGNSLSVVYTSYDGKEWDKVLESKDVLCSIAYDGNHTVVIGGKSVILTSNDCINWNKKYIETNNQYISKMLYCNNFIAFVPEKPYKGYILTSPDGMSWKKQALNNEIIPQVTIWNGSQFISLSYYYEDDLSYHGALSKSNDGIKWDKPEEIDTNFIANALAYDGKQYVAIGTQIVEGALYTCVSNLNSSPTECVNRQIKLLINGREIKTDIYPVIEKNRVLVPLRAIFEGLGANVLWNGNTRTVTGILGDTKVELKVDSLDAFVNSNHKVLEVPAKVINGRTLVPVRFISESLGANVEWDNNNYIVNVNK